MDDLWCVNTLRLYRLLLVLTCAFAFTSMDGRAEQYSAVGPKLVHSQSTVAARDGFIHARGRDLVLNGEQTRLRAVNFSNFYYMDITGDNLLASSHHSERDFARVREMGFNSIRFAFDGDWYAEYPEEFWEWLDINIDWARRYELYLILDLHTPIGSFWLDPTGDNVDFAIWTDPAVRARNVAMWHDIAARYRDEHHIAGYDILNEPVTTDATGQQWRELAQEMVDAIRAVDRNHLIVVGALEGVEGRYGAREEQGVERQFVVDDDNVMYDFHFYQPIRYTHQFAGWMERPVDEGGRYPDPRVILPTAPPVALPGSSVKGPDVEAGTTDWKLYDSGPVTVADPSAIAAMPVAVARGVFRGTVHFDDIRVTEYAPDGKLLGEIIIEPLGGGEALHWYSWQQHPGEHTTFGRESTGFADDGSLSITGAGDPAGIGAATVSGWSNHDTLFRVTPGNKYRIVARMRGDQLELETDTGKASASLDLNVFGPSPGAPGMGFLGRGKEYLKHELSKPLKFGLENNVPMSVLEFGLTRQNYTMPNAGGERWVADVIDLLDEHGASFAYWEYHGSRMGIYLREEGGIEQAVLPTRPNPNLVEALERALAQE